MTALLLAAALSAATPRPTATPAVACKTYGKAELNLYARSEALYVVALDERGAAADRDFKEAEALADGAATMHDAYVRCRNAKVNA